MFDIILEVLDMANREKRNKQNSLTQIGKISKVKLSLFANDMMLHTENSKDATEKLELISINLKKFQDAKLIHRNMLHFYILTIKDQERKNKE